MSCHINQIAKQKLQCLQAVMKKSVDSANIRSDPQKTSSTVSSDVGFSETILRLLWSLRVHSHG